MLGFVSGFFLTLAFCLSFWLTTALAADLESGHHDRDLRSGRHEYCFEITALPTTDAPTGSSIPAEDPKYLCMYASDLVHYPRSVVTFTLREKNITKRPKYRYHYTMFRPGVFGRTAHPDLPKVVFDRQHATVFLGFLGGKGKTYHYQKLNIEGESGEAASVASSQPEFGRGPTSTSPAIDNQSHEHHENQAEQNN